MIIIIIMNIIIIIMVIITAAKMPAPATASKATNDYVITNTNT